MVLLPRDALSAEGRTDTLTLSIRPSLRHLSFWNGNMAAKTRNSFIPETTSVRIEIRTANLGFLITPNSKKVCPGDCDNDR